MTPAGRKARPAARALRSRAGFSLVEAAISVIVLGLLFSAVLGIYVIGSHAWARGDVQSELLQSLQVPLGQMSRVLEQTAYDSLTVDNGTALSCLSASDPETGYLLNDEGRTRWRRYQVFYRDEDRVLRRDLPLVPDADQQITPGPIEVYDSGSGTLPLASYRTGEGTVLGRNLVDLSVVVPAGTRLVELSLTVEKQRYGRPDPERMTLSTVVAVRR